MDIRKAKESDFETLVSFYTKMNKVINERTDKYCPDNPVFPSDDMIREAIVNGGQLIGEESGELVAACIVNHDCDEAYNGIKWNIDALKEEVSILHALRILPEFEGRGFAGQMMKYVCDTARSNHQKAIRLDVLEGYDVEGFYVRFGFKYVDTIEIFYEDIGSKERFRLFEFIFPS